MSARVVVEGPARMEGVRRSRGRRWTGVIAAVGEGWSRCVGGDVGWERLGGACLQIKSASDSAKPLKKVVSVRQAPEMDAGSIAFVFHLGPCQGRQS